MRVYSYVMSLAGKTHMAEEITQETFYKAFTTKASFRGESDAVTWLCSIARNLFTLKASCVIDNPYDELRQGMYVKIDLPYGRLKDAILVKDASVGSDQLGKFLYTLNDSNRIVYTPVTLGELYQDTLRVVTKGLEPGTRYVTSAILKVRNGMEVKPVMTK